MDSFGTSQITLTEFLLARITEDEDLARDATEGDLFHRYAAMTPGAIADHIARHDPARVLAECEAKRKVVEEHARHRGDCDRDYQYGDAPCATLGYLALPYAEHPDYRDEWRA